MRIIIAFCTLLISINTIRAQETHMSGLLIEGETWKQVGKDLDHLWGLASDKDGNVYVTDPMKPGVIRIALDGTTTVLADKEKGLAAITIGPEGKVFVSQPEKKRIAVIEGDKITSVTEELAARSLAVTAKGAVYALGGDDKIYLITAGKSKVVAEGLGFATALGLWPDQATMVVGDSESAHLWALRIETDGSLTSREKYYTPVREKPGEPSFPMAITSDKDGRIYAATTQGVQIFDATGRPIGVMLKPIRERVTGVAFGGKDGDLMHIICGGKLYARKTNAKGVR
jgi:sugar lactone lactonase YvrE